MAIRMNCFIFKLHTNVILKGELNQLYEMALAATASAVQAKSPLESHYAYPSAVPISVTDFSTANLETSSAIVASNRPDEETTNTPDSARLDGGRQLAHLDASGSQYNSSCIVSDRTPDATLKSTEKERVRLVSSTGPARESLFYVSNNSSVPAPVPYVSPTTISSSPLFSSSAASSSMSSFTSLTQQHSKPRSPAPVNLKACQHTPSNSASHCGAAISASALAAAQLGIRTQTAVTAIRNDEIGRSDLGSSAGNASPVAERTVSQPPPKLFPISSPGLLDLAELRKQGRLPPVAPASPAPQTQAPLKITESAPTSSCHL
jgi:hypothetical protein